MGVSIYHTDGPASHGKEAEMFSAGSGGARLTFSFSTPEYHLERAQLLAAAAKKVGAQARVIADLEGGGLRLGMLETGGDKNGSFNVAKGELVPLVQTDTVVLAEGSALPIPDKDTFDGLEAGNVLIIGDGSAAFTVVEKEGKKYGESVFAGTVEGRRGLFVQGGDSEPVCMTTKDEEALAFIAQHDEFHAVALSFVSSVDDIEKARQIMKKNGSVKPIVAKIETIGGVEHIDVIAETADEIMVARGDLALALPWQEMPRAVDKIVSACKKHVVPFIMATQVAESMVTSPMMTRAEMSDLWQWKLRGVTGVLLSRETVWGQHPLEVVEAVRILLDTPH